MIYGWTDEHVMRMPIRRFLAMRKAGEKIHARKLNHFFYEMCDVVAVSGTDSKYHKEIKEVYWNRLLENMDIDPAKNKREMQARTALDLKNKNHKKFALKWMENAEKHVLAAHGYHGPQEKREVH